MATPLLLRDSRVRIWEGSGTEPSSVEEYVAEIRVLGIKNGWQNIRKADGNYIDVKGGKRVNISLTFTMVLHTGIINLLNSDEKINMRLSWVDDDADTDAVIGNLLCQGGRIDAYNIELREQGFGKLSVDYHANTFTLSIN